MLNTFHTHSIQARAADVPREKTYSIIFIDLSLTAPLTAIDKTSWLSCAARPPPPGNRQSLNEQNALHSNVTAFISNGKGVNNLIRM